jgi:hypothetical protein
MSQKTCCLLSELDGQVKNTSFLMTKTYLLILLLTVSLVSAGLPDYLRNSQKTLRLQPAASHLQVPHFILPDWVTDAHQLHASPHTSLQHVVTC